MPEQQGPTNLGPKGPGTDSASVLSHPAGTISVPEQKSSSSRTARRRSTIAFLLDELQNKTETIPDTFQSPQRDLPAPPAPAILIRAVESCSTAFLDTSSITSKITDRRNQLLESICRLADENQRLALASHMAEFESRLIKSFPEQAEQEINGTYANLFLLLSAEAGARSLPWQSRLLAASHFISHLAVPESVCLGNRLGAQIVCLIQKLFAGKPAALAEILSSACLFGQHQAFDGRIVVLDEHSFKPGQEELKYKPGENSRSYAVKVLQCMLLNNCLPRRSRPMTYSETPGRPGRGYSGQIVRALDGEALNPKVGANLSFLELSLLSKHQFGCPQTVLINDSSFSERSQERLDALKGQNLIHIQFPEDLRAALAQASSEKRLSVTVAVDERRLLADSYQDGINHAVNVIQFSEYGMLKIFNPQLLPGTQRSARIPLQKLFNASLSCKS